MIETTNFIIIHRNFTIKLIKTVPMFISPHHKFFYVKLNPNIVSRK